MASDSYSVGLKLPPSPGNDSVLTTLGDNLTEAFQSLSSPDGHTDAGRDFRTAFTTLSQQGLYLVEPGVGKDIEPPLSPVHTMCSVGNSIETVFQSGGAVTISLFVSDRTLFASVEPNKFDREKRSTYTQTNLSELETVPSLAQQVPDDIRKEDYYLLSDNNAGITFAVCLDKTHPRSTLQTY